MDTPVKIKHVEATEAVLIADLAPLQWGLSTDTDVLVLKHGYDGGHTIINRYGVLDEDNMASDSDTDVPTQQSVKAYVDASSGTPGGLNTEIQFNNAGVFDGDTGLTYILASKTLVITAAGGDSLSIVGEKITASDNITIEAPNSGVGQGGISIEAATTMYLQGLTSLQVWSNSDIQIENAAANILIKARADDLQLYALLGTVDITAADVEATGDTIKLYANASGAATVGAFEIHSGYSAVDTLVKADTEAGAPTADWKNFQLFPDIPAGKTPEFTISGYKAADALRTAVFKIDPLANDTFQLSGVNNFRYYGNGSFALFPTAAAGETPIFSVSGYRTAGAIDTMEISVGSVANQRGQFSGCAGGYGFDDTLYLSNSAAGTIRSSTNPTTQYINFDQVSDTIVMGNKLSVNTQISIDNIYNTWNQSGAVVMGAPTATGYLTQYTWAAPFEHTVIQLNGSADVYQLKGQSTIASVNENLAYFKITQPVANTGQFEWHTTSANDTNPDKRMVLSPVGKLSVYVDGDTQTSTPTGLEVYNLPSDGVGQNGIGCYIKIGARNSDADPESWVAAGAIGGILTDVSETAEDGKLVFQVMVAGSLADSGEFNSSGLSINGGLTVLGAASTSITMPDNTAYPFWVGENSLGYIACTTTNGAEKIHIGNSTHNQDVSFYGSGDVVFVEPTLWQVGSTAVLKIDRSASPYTVEIGGNGDTTTTIKMQDNNAYPFWVGQGSSGYIACVTTDASEAIEFGNTTTNPDYNFLGSGAFNHDGTTFGVLGAAPAAQIAHVANPSGGGTVDAEARTAINSILATLETFGFHAAT